MALILSIDTATAVCAACLSLNGQLLAYTETRLEKAHSSALGLMVRDMLGYVNKGVEELDAVAVTIGPGSYTGLRVGLSFAKGIAFSKGVPLIAIGTLNAILRDYTRQIRREGAYLIPMIDARRMEVYQLLATEEGEILSDPTPLVVTEDSFRELGDKKIVCMGDGAPKLRAILSHRDNIVISDFEPCAAKGLALLAEEAYAIGQFADLAYTEPLYLKEFKATTAKKLF